MVRSRYRRYRRYRRRRFTRRPRAYRRRSYGRYRRYRRVKTLRPGRPMLGFVPTKKWVTMRYIHNQSMLTGTIQGAATMSNRIDLGSVYDPDYEVGGTYAHGYTIFSHFYNHYLVSAAKFQIKVRPPVTLQALTPCVLCWKIDDDATTNWNGMTWTQAALDPGTHVFHIGASGTPDYRVHTFNGSYSLRKFFGIKDIKDVIDEHGAMMGQRPHDRAILCVGLFPYTPTLVAPPWDVSITIDYRVYLTERKDMHGLATSFGLGAGAEEEEEPPGIPGE